MAARHGAGQYEDAFSPRRLQIWGVTKPGPQRPSLRRGCTRILTNDRGHLLPTVPRSQTSPWGTFVGTWDMPPRIPPPKLDLTARSAPAATRLLEQIHRPSTLTHACNGLQTEITGKLQEPSQRSSQASATKGTQPTGTPGKDPPNPGAPQPSCGGEQQQAEVSPEPPAASQPGG
ncbi:protein Flattop [Calypte anna]|uniref:protein Flattop n=1 Tax=Calypte anna TaxID=9244 RepID=UPI0011C47AFD|nr:protein Flattop [Calypte anna]